MVKIGQNLVWVSIFARARDAAPPDFRAILWRKSAAQFARWGIRAPAAPKCGGVLEISRKKHFRECKAFFVTSFVHLCFVYKVKSLRNMDRT